MLRRIFWILAGLCIFAMISVHLAASQQGALPDGELVQYVRDAKKAGLSDQQIEKNAVSAGWTAAAVTDAIGMVGKAPASSSETEAKSKPESKSVPSFSESKLSAPAELAKDPVKIPPVPPVPANPSGPASGAPVSGGAPASGAPAGGAPAGAEPAVNRGVPDDYQIGAGDVLTINVWKEPEASIPSVVVRPDGKISMPLLKDVGVVGMTPKQVERLITTSLAKFITGADVTIVVTGINSKKVYLVGAVKKEGPLPYTYRMSVMQALSEAGGLTDYAKRKKIYVLRNENGRQFRLPFDYDAVLKGEHMELNIPLLAGDTVVVPH